MFQRKEAPRFIYSVDRENGDGVRTAIVDPELLNVVLAIDRPFNL